MANLDNVALVDLIVCDAYEEMNISPTPATVTKLTVVPVMLTAIVIELARNVLYEDPA